MIQGFSLHGLDSPFSMGVHVRVQGSDGYGLGASVFQQFMKPCPQEFPIIVPDQMRCSDPLSFHVHDKAPRLLLDPVGGGMNCRWSYEEALAFKLDK